MVLPLPTSPYMYMPFGTFSGMSNVALLLDRPCPKMAPKKPFLGCSERDSMVGCTTRGGVVVYKHIVQVLQTFYNGYSMTCQQCRKMGKKLTSLMLVVPQNALQNTSIVFIYRSLASLVLFNPYDPISSRRVGGQK